MLQDAVRQMLANLPWGGNTYQTFNSAAPSIKLEEEFLDYVVESLRKADVQDEDYILILMKPLQVLEIGNIMNPAVLSAGTYVLGRDNPAGDEVPWLVVKGTPYGMHMEVCQRKANNGYGTLLKGDALTQD